MTSPAPFPRHLSFLLALVSICWAGVAHAADQTRGKVSRTVVSQTAIKPGETAMMAVVVQIEKGFHAQSAQPLDKFQIPFRVKFSKTAGLQPGEPAYPAGQVKDYPNLGKLSVYDGQEVVVRVPLTASTDAKPGELKLPGQVSYQACDENLCYPPETLKFEVTVKIAASGEETKAVEDSVFKEMPTTAPAGADLGGTSEETAASATNGLGDRSLLGWFGIAFLVGIVFNIVPCVLPVLPLKIMGFYENAQNSRLKSLTFGLAFGLGVVCAFAILGLLVVVLKRFTWGEIFSNPAFAAVLVVVLIAMALNMFGLFTVNLPPSMYAVSPRHDTYFGNVLYGIFTAALSTPCTFGLFVSLIGVAATQPAFIGMMLIMVVGTGMAFPYVLLSAFPEVARNFPRTGPWAELVKQLMGFVLLAVAVFFAQGWIGRLIGQHNVWWLIFACLAAGAIFLVARALQYRKTLVAPVVAGVLALAIVVPAFAVTRNLAVQPYEWVAYTPQSLSDARATNEVVLVDFTASWCTNCHWLEATVLNSRAIVGAVDDHKVRMIRADLSDSDAPGWKLLKEDLRAAGVPLTVIYSSNLSEPIRLPGLYSKDDLEAAFDRAAQARIAMR